MPTRGDYYKILNIPKSASLEEIKKAYREAVLRYHPDRVPEKEKKDAEEKFKEISEAYAVLSDPEKRALYDQHGHSGIDQRYAQEDIYKGADFSSVFSDLSDYGFSESLFNQIFGDSADDLLGQRRKGKTRTARGRDLQISVDITLEEAVLGGEKVISFHRYDLCPTCQGTGAGPETRRKTCSHCRGSGQEIVSSGGVRLIRSCTQCNGQGSVFENPCPTCHGEGRVQNVRRLKVSIPSGIDNGAELRLAGEGEIGPQGRGDLFLFIEVHSHPLFKREGFDLQTEVTIPFTIAVLGGEVRVPTLTGSVMMKIPAGTQNGMLFRLKGKGVPNKKSDNSGDEIVKIGIEIPRSLTPQQRKLIEEFAKTFPEHAA